MTTTPPPPDTPRPSRFHWSPVWDLVAFSLTLILGLTVALALPLFPSRVQIAVGQPAREDYLAPSYIKFESPALTAQDRATAAANPANLVYDFDDTLIETQRGKLLDTVSLIRDIRDLDSPPTSTAKRQRLLGLPDLALSDADVNALLTLSSADYGSLFADTLRVYDATMRSGRISDATELARIRADLSRQFGATLPADERTLAARLLSPYLAVNTRLDAAATAAAQDKAAAAVPPHTVEVQKGEAILRVGQIADDLALEKLEHAGYRNRDVSPLIIAADAGVIALLVLLLAVYLFRFQLPVWHNRRQLVLLALVILAPLSVARFVVPGHAVLPYLLPLATVGMLISVLLDANLAIVVSILMSLLISLLSIGSVELPIYYMVGGLIGVAALWRAERVTTFILAGVYVAAGSFVAAILLRVISGGALDQNAVLTLLAAAAINGGLAASLTFATFSVLGTLFGLTTVLQLLELAHPTQPLLRRLMHEAPGTYHHSLVVSNLAERAAELVGADPLLARVAAYYHDIGKVVNPQAFIDNQAGRANIHNTLDPYTSAQMIFRAHVTDGITLATRSRLPRRIVDAIPQHHGTTLIKYFYHKALEADPTTPEAPFRYPGPRPQTKEAAILMLADGVEATVRSLEQSGVLRNRGPEDCATPTAEENTIPFVVRKVIRERLQDGQLDESDLTVRDLARIQDAFCAMLVGIYHPRIVYPDRPATAPSSIPAGAETSPTPPGGNGIHPNGAGGSPPSLLPTESEKENK